MREVNPLVFEVRPHPVWLRTKNEVVTIDRLRPYRSYKSDDDGLQSHPPPVDTDLSCLGDKYLQNFKVNEGPADVDVDMAEMPMSTGLALSPPV